MQSKDIRLTIFIVSFNTIRIKFPASCLFIGKAKIL